jgi:hypothetical protein
VTTATKAATTSAPASATIDPPFFSIPELAMRWRMSRASVYNALRGHRVLDFAAPGRRGHKLVPAETVRQIESKRLKVFR